MRRQTWLLCLSIYAAACVSAWADANFPSKPVKVIIPFAPSSSVEVVVRAIGEHFQKITGQPFVIDNKGGANGTIGAELLTRSPADGYTIMAATIGQMSLNPHVYKTLPYDPDKSFAPITLLTQTNYVLVIHPSIPAKTFAEFVAYAKKNPTALKAGSTGVGTPSHFLIAALNKEAGIQVQNVPYRGSGPALSDMLGGHIQVTFQPALSVKQLAEEGKVIALAASSDARLPLLPSVPTFAELGHPSVLAPLWSGLVAPAGTPNDVVDKLSGVVARILKMPEVAERMRASDQMPVGNTPAEFRKFLAEDRARWGKMVRDSGFEPTN